MALLTRALQKIFGSTGGPANFGQIGSKAAGAPITTKDLETIQSLSEYDQGMQAIVSDQGTSVLPYLEDINSLHFLETSQLAYLFQSGVPGWDDATEYYQDISLVLESGVIWKDTFGTSGTPNVNFQPSTNQDKWEPVSAAIEKQTINASGSLTLGFSHWKVEIDTSGGNINISALPTPNFAGQKLHIYVSGSGTAIIAGGTGIPTRDLYITSDIGGAFLESVNFGGNLVWRVIISTQERTAGEGVIYWKNGDPATNGDKILLLHGQSILRANYSELDAKVYVGDADNAAAAAAGGGFFHADNPDGTNPNPAGIYLILPDTRGYVLRGIDAGALVDPDGASRFIGDTQLDAMQGHFHGTSQALRVSPSAANPQAGTGWYADIGNTENITGPITDGVNGTPRISSETRMVNVSANFGITY